MIDYKAATIKLKQIKKEMIFFGFRLDVATEMMVDRIWFKKNNEVKKRNNEKENQRHTT